MHTLPLPEAARWLKLDEGAVRSLIEGGYFKSTGDNIALLDVKAFLARNADGGVGSAIGVAAAATDPQALLDALDARTDELATQAYDRFTHEIPEAMNWSPRQRDTFLQQAKGRFGAILAVMGQGSEVDAALQRDLEEVGANAAWAGSSLPHLLIVLRISRDLLLQTAMRLSDEREGRLNASLAAFAARMLPAIDRLTDALANGYWNAMVEKHTEQLDRLTGLLERTPYGVYEADMDGVVQYANPALATLLGKTGEDLEGQALTQVFQTSDGGASVGALIAEPANDIGQVRLKVSTGLGDVPLDIDTVVRRDREAIVGFAGVVRAVPLTEKPIGAESMVRHIYELRRSLEILTEAGSVLERHSDKIGPAQVKQAGVSVRQQGDRLMTIVDELDNDRRSD